MYSGSKSINHSAARFCGVPGVSTSAELETVRIRRLIKVALSLSGVLHLGVGATEGDSLGLKVGAIDGIKVGAAVIVVDGDPDGLVLGLSVPKTEGSVEGNPEV